MGNLSKATRWVGDVAWQELQDGGDHKAESTRNVRLGTLVSRLGLDVELESHWRIREWVRVMGDGYRHDGWMNGWMWQDSNRNC